MLNPRRSSSVWYARFDATAWETVLGGVIRNLLCQGLRGSSSGWCSWVDAKAESCYQSIFMNAVWMEMATENGRDCLRIVPFDYLTAVVSCSSL